MSETNGRNEMASNDTEGGKSDENSSVKSADKSGVKREYRCEPCDKDFTTKKGLKKHSDKHHPQDEDDWASEDGGSFRTANSATFHPCPHADCDKFFNRPSRLKTHLLIHTGERPYKCQVEGCDSSYARKEHLKRHVHNCHNSPAKIKDEQGLFFGSF